jgi:hypothetical protein
MNHILKWYHIWLFGFIFVEVLELKSDSQLHDAVGSQIYQLHYAAERQNLTAAFCIMQRGVKPHDAAGSQILPPHNAAGSQFGSRESSLKTLEDAQGP